MTTATTASAPKGVLDVVPAPSEVRELLARNFRERRILSALLRVSEKAAEERRHREVVDGKARARPEETL